MLGGVLQGAAADCNSAEVTHAWFDSRVAHQIRIITYETITIFYYHFFFYAGYADHCFSNCISR